MSAPEAAGTPAGQPARVLFIGGLGRSGSTLVELLLAQSPDVCALGEVVHLWQRGLGDDDRCGCGVRFSGCEFWQAVGQAAFGGWSRVDLGEVAALRAAVDRTRHLRRLAGPRLPDGLREQVRRYTDHYTRIYRAALAVSGARLVVDSSKHASLAYTLRWAEGLDLRVLHLVRDSRAVAHSWSRQVRRPEVAGREEYMPRFSSLAVCALWTVQNTAFDRLARHAPVTRLRYEDFTAHPGEWLRRVRATAGLPGAELAALDDPAVPVRTPHSVAGNPLRFAAAPIRVRRDDAWRTALPWHRRAAVGALTLPLRLRYGYRRLPGPA
jgi:hypothetical protein